MASSVLLLNASVQLEIDPQRLSSVWNGPEGRSGVEVSQELRRHLESPLNFPPLRQSIVPGDRVVIAVDGDLPEAKSLLAPIIEILHEHGIDREQIAVLATSSRLNSIEGLVPTGVQVILHDRSDPERMAYLATTASEHRVYLNRELIEADFVLSIGCVAPDAQVGTRGPWSTLYPGLSDAAAITLMQKPTTDDFQARLEEIQEVAWLLGNQFQIAVVPGATGVREIIAGENQSVREAATRRMRKSWTFEVDQRSELVVVGLGNRSDVESVWFAFARAVELVRRGGKIIAMSGARGEIGPAASRLIGDDKPGLSSLRGAEKEPDYASARALATALDWADLYLLSELDADRVESMGIMPLSTPSEAARLAQTASEVTILNHAEWTRVLVKGDEE